MTRAARLGSLLERFEVAERAGNAVMIHSSFCAPATGAWVALVKPVGWEARAMGIPIFGHDLERVLEKACEIAEGG